MKRLPLALLVIGLVVSGSNVFAAAGDECNKLNTQAEAALDAGQLAQARTFANQAIATCAKADGKTARPQIVMSVAANVSGQHTETVKWSKEALTQEPGNPLAYMNMSSGYYGLEQFEESLAAALEGLKNPGKYAAKLNTNAGLAAFNQSVKQNKFTEAAQSEKYFLASIQLDKKIAQNYFFVGTIQDAVKNNPTAAVENFIKGCALGHSQSCTGLESAKAKVKAAAAAGTTNRSAASASAPMASGASSVEEAKLWEQLKGNYVKKGLDGASAESAVSQIRTGLGSLTPEQRTQSLKKMVESTR